MTSYRFHETPTVTLFVGTSQKPFYVHVDLLCDVSSFFKAAFTGDFKEGSDKTMQLPEDDENTFSLFIDWLYHQRYEMSPQPDDDSEDSDDEDDDASPVVREGDRYLPTFKLFVLAEKYDVPALKWLLTETLLADGDTSPYGPSDASVIYLYGHTAQSAGIRRWIADWHAWYMDPVYFKSPEFRAIIEKHPDFSADINLSYCKNLKKGFIYRPFKRVKPDEYKDK